MHHFYHTFLRLSSFLIAFIFSFPAFSQSVTGTVTGSKGNIIAYASVYVKGTSIGTTTNNEGKYQLELKPGTYTLTCAHIGYLQQQRTIQVKAGEKLLIDFTMPEQTVELNEVVVKANAEDPAYEIMRKAIAARRGHLAESSDFESTVYIKGLIRTLKVPKAVLGQKVKLNNDIIDSTGKGIIYFSESVTRYTRRKDGQVKENVVSARVSGNSQGFGFNSPSDLEINFYENLITLDGMNSRGYVSPLNDNALGFYNYKYEGSFYEDGKEVNRIRVTPKRSLEPVFSQGFVQIYEGSWRLHSADLIINKNSQIELVDTLHITQEMGLVENDRWMPRYTRIEATFGILGFKAGADFAAVYSNYDLNSRPKSFWKDHVYKSIDTSANKKSLEFWEGIRPIPLTTEEKKDYVKKDSLEKKFKDPRYLDSLDKIANRFSVTGALLTGQTFFSRVKKTSLFIPPVLNMIQYNTVEQWVIALEPSFFKSSDTGSFTIAPRLRYSMPTNRFNMDVRIDKRIGNNYKKRVNLTLAGGQYIYQINGANPIQPLNNTLGTLLYSVNYMKVYQKAYGLVGASKNIGRGLSASVQVSYEDRTPLENTDTSFVWNRYKNRQFTNNYPQELPGGFFERHQAFITRVAFRYQPGVKYIQYPNRLVATGSDAPVFNVVFTTAIRGIGKADADFSKWTVRVRDEVSLKLGGTLNYSASVGGFLSNRNVQLPDWQHFLGNQTVAASPYVGSFQLAPYYANSTRDKVFTTAHVQWSLNGLITNKVPLFRRLNWHLVTGANAFYVDGDRNYSEVFVGLKNILKIFRVDWVAGYDSQSRRWRNGIVLGAGGLLSGDNVD